MQRYGLLEDPVPEPARRWIETFLDAFGHEVHTLREAAAEVAKLREESVIVPALELERLRNRQVLFFLDAVSQYVDEQPELRGLPLAHDVPAIADEFGIAHEDAFAALRMALTGSYEGPPLSLLFPLLGHDRIMIRIGAISSHVLHGRGLEPIRFGPGGVPFETIQATRPGRAGVVRPSCRPSRSRRCSPTCGRRSKKTRPPPAGWTSSSAIPASTRWSATAPPTRCGGAASRCCRASCPTPSAS